MLAIILDREKYNIILLMAEKRFLGLWIFRKISEIKSIRYR